MEKFNTGAVRSGRKPRFDLIPKVALDRLAKRFTGELIPEAIAGDPTGLFTHHATGGALKYGECNWEKGLPTSDVINHIYDHLSNYVNLFRETLRNSNGNMEAVKKCLVAHSLLDDDDLAGAMWGLTVLMHQETTQMFHDDNFTVFSKESSKVRVDGDESTLSNARDNESFKIPIPINKDVTRSPAITQAQIDRTQVRILEVERENNRIKEENLNLITLVNEFRNIIKGLNNVKSGTKSNSSSKRKSRR